MDERKIFVKSCANLVSIATALVLLFAATFVHAVPRVEYYHTDALGSVIVSTDEGGNVLWRESYRPFGDRMLKQASTQDNTPFYTGKPHDDATGLSYFGARYYDPRLGRFLGVDSADVDPENIHSFNRYAYANNNPYKNVDPDGNSPISVLAKQIAKQGLKQGLKRFAKQQSRRLSRYMSKSQAKEFASDMADLLSSFDSSPLEIAIELIPIAGDLYGAGKFGKQIATAYKKMQDMENKWVGKIAGSLKGEQRKKFMKAMRNSGVRDAKLDQGIPMSGSGLEGHHKKWVSRSPSTASDPRNIKFYTPEAHRELHR